MAPKSIYEQVAETIKKYPLAKAIVFENKKYNYHQFGREILKAASKLAALGIKPRDVVTVLLPNSPESVFIFYGLSAIGAISYNIHPLTPATTVAKMMKRVNSKYLISLINTAHDNWVSMPNDVKVIGVNPYVGISFFKASYLNYLGRNTEGVIKFWKVKGLPTVPLYSPKEEREDAVYLNTGGTNGEPKVVRISNESMNHVGSNSYQLIGGKVTDIGIMTAVPMFHVLGLGMAIHVPFSAGASACLILKFNTKEAINQMKKGNANVIIGVPALYNALLSRDKFYGPHLKKQIVAYLGGDYCPMSLIERWNEAMEKYGSKARLFVGYGLTETSTACNVNTFGGRNKYGSVGKPLPGVLNKIIDPETGEELPAGKYGEILVGGPSLMTGYFDDEKLNEKTLFKDKDGNPWLHTMDYGCMDEDGYLYFKQRLRRIVKVNAETLCPSDVEEVVNSLPGIYESYCYGVPNARKGNIFRLLAVIRRGDHPWSEEEAEKAIKEAVKKSLPPAYFPDKIIFMKKLPRTPLGKIDISSIEGAETH